MRLETVDTGHAPREAAILSEIAKARGVPTASGVLKTLFYRPDIFGEPFSNALDEAMRGPSDWTPAERELFAGYVSWLNECHF